MRDGTLSPLEEDLKKERKFVLSIFGRSKKKSDEISRKIEREMIILSEGNEESNLRGRGIRSRFNCAWVDTALGWVSVVGASSVIEQGE